ncbi:MAG: hypothetical protein NTW54_07495 [Bacteroidetes bacterium]|nr:hypothetical protein [Bacteroidota bacterium]
MVHQSRNFLLAVLLSVVLNSCSFLFGSKKDQEVDQVFEQGRIDPNLLPSAVGYVPILPFFTHYINPVDVYVGFDNMLYVCDDLGVHVSDISGREYRVIPIPNATKIVQDRRLFTYVCGRVNVTRSGQTYNLPAIYKIMNAATRDAYTIIDTLIQPDCDASRNNFRGSDDEKISFTGMATTSDNTLYISRSGPRNDQAAFSAPDNAVLIFDASGLNTSYAKELNPNNSSLKSVLGLTGITSFCAPPQVQFGMNQSKDFLIIQGDLSQPVEFRTLWIKHNLDAGTGETTYGQNNDLLYMDTSKASRFLYDSYHFKHPVDVCISPDKNGYIFVVDDVLDSVFIFTQAGYEGVNAPATSANKKQIIASFGGHGFDLFHFKKCSGVAYFNKILYLADKENNRICRYKLSTDIE